jgi:hypothetical protein
MPAHRPSPSGEGRAGGAPCVDFSLHVFSITFHPCPPTALLLLSAAVERLARRALPPASRAGFALLPLLSPLLSCAMLTALHRRDFWVPPPAFCEFEPGGGGQIRHGLRPHRLGQIGRRGVCRAPSLVCASTSHLRDQRCRRAVVWSAKKQAPTRPPRSTRCTACWRPSLLQPDPQQQFLQPLGVATVAAAAIAAAVATAAAAAQHTKPHHSGLSWWRRRSLVAACHLQPCRAS